jgi:hypothetical protein
VPGRTNYISEYFILKSLYYGDVAGLHAGCHKSTRASVSVCRLPSCYVLTWPIFVP